MTKTYLLLFSALALTFAACESNPATSATQDAAEKTETAMKKVAADTPSLYVVSNKAAGNTVYKFASDGGGYALDGEYETGGKGTGDLEIPALKKDDTHPLANGDDPLISANALAATADGSHIVVVNPGNATLSLMKMDGGSLKSVSSAPASDKFPISVAIHGNHVIAASVGKDNMHGSISHYKILDGRLISIAGSRRDLGARPSTVRFSTNGAYAIVDELVTGKIKTFSLGSGTLSAEPVSVIDSPRADGRFQAIPVGFEVKAGSNGDVLIVSEARFLTPEFGLRDGDGSVVQSPKYSWQTGSLSTYTLSADGQLFLVSGDVLTGTEIEGGEIANCWVALSPDGKTLWAANALSSSISSFDIAADGTATLKNATAYKDDSEKLFFSDMNVSADGKTLYQLVGNTGQVAVFDIKSNGDLSLRETVGGMPALGTYGMLVLP